MPVIVVVNSTFPTCDIVEAEKPCPVCCRDGACNDKALTCQTNPNSDFGILL